jgi:hypothetical protein
MVVALYGIALVMIVGGATTVARGYVYVMVEFGWTMVIAGTVAATGGVLLFGLAHIASRLKRLETVARLAGERADPLAPEALAHAETHERYAQAPHLTGRAGPGLTGLGPAAMAGAAAAAVVREQDAPSQPEPPVATFSAPPLTPPAPVETPPPLRATLPPDATEAPERPVEPVTEPAIVVPSLSFDPPETNEPSEPPVDPDHPPHPSERVEAASPSRFNLRSLFGSRSAGDDRPLPETEDRGTDLGEPVQESPEPVERSFEESRPVPDAGHEAQAPEEEMEPAAAPVVVGTYMSGGNQYVMYSDGSIEAETPTGRYRFKSLDELKSFIETGSEAAAT